MGAQQLVTTSWDVKIFQENFVIYHQRWDLAVTIQTNGFMTRITEDAQDSGMEDVNQAKIILTPKKIAIENVLSHVDPLSVFFLNFRDHARVLMMNGTMMFPPKRADHFPTVDVWETETDFQLKMNVNLCVGGNVKFQFAANPRLKEHVLVIFPDGFMTKRQESARSFPTQDAWETITDS